MTAVGRRLAAGVQVVALCVVVASAVPQLLGVATGLDAATVVSGSMLPGIAPGDVILTRPSSELAPGDVIRFAAPAEVTAAYPGVTSITHRVVAHNPDGTYTTRGDANPVVDPVPVEAGQVIGKVERVAAGAGLAALHLRPVLWATAGVCVWGLLPGAVRRRFRRSR